MIYSRSIDTCISHVSKVCVTPLQLMKDLRSYLFSLTKRNSEGFCFCEGLCGSYPCEVFVSLVTGGPPSLFPLCHTPVPEASKKWYSVFLTDHTLDVWILYPGFLFINIRFGLKLQNKTTENHSDWTMLGPMPMLNQSLRWEGPKALTDGLEPEHTGEGLDSVPQNHGDLQAPVIPVGKRKMENGSEETGYGPIFILPHFLISLTLTQRCFPQLLYGVGDLLAAFQLPSAPHLQNLENKRKTNLLNSYPMKIYVSRSP